MNPSKLIPLILIIVLYLTSIGLAGEFNFHYWVKLQKGSRFIYRSEKGVKIEKDEEISLNREFEKLKLDPALYIDIECYISPLHTNVGSWYHRESRGIGCKFFPSSESKGYITEIWDSVACFHNKNDGSKTFEAHVTLDFTRQLITDKTEITATIGINCMRKK